MKLKKLELGRVMKQQIKRKINIIITLGIIISIPLIILVLTDGTKFVNFEKAIPIIFTQIIAMPILKNTLVHLGIISLSILTAIISITYLFEVKFNDTLIEKIKTNRVGKFIIQHILIQTKHGWHILVGYFLSILLIDSFVVYDFYNTQRLLQEITLYQSYVAIIPSIAAILLIARVLSRFDIKIIGTNLGVFILLIYISQLLYQSAAVGVLPFEPLRKLAFDTEQNAEGVFMLYGSLVLISIIVVFLDWIIIRKIMKKDW